MADFGIGIDVETPQEVLKRVRAQRAQQRISNNPAAIQQANLASALDSIFGNREAMDKQRVSDALTRASQVSPVEGEDDLTAELRRLQSMRDAVAEIDPSTAAQINQQMLKYGQLRIERNKLQAEEAREEEDQKMQRELHPAALLAAQIKLEQDANEEELYANKAGDIRVVTKLDSIARKQLRESGFFPVDKPKVTGTKDEVFGLGKPVANDLQQALIDSRGALQEVMAVGEKWDPSFVQLPTQLLMGGANAAERMGLKLSAETSAKLANYGEFRRNAVDGFNRYIKSITGAAMAVAEAERIQKAYPDVEKDGPTQFLAKSRGVVKQLLGVQKRAEMALTKGLKVTGDQWEAVAIPDVSEAEVDSMMNQMFGVPLPNKKAAGGKPAMSDDDLVNKYNAAGQ